MSREIKFRFWNGKDMTYGMDGITQNRLGISNSENICPLITITGYEKFVPNWGLKGSMMQYTGLKDKNGKEIYEGDRVKVKLPAGGFWGSVATVKEATIKYEAEQGGYIAEWEYSKNQHDIQLNCDLDIEVIGNIYQSLPQ